MPPITSTLPKADRTADLAHIRADRARAQALRGTLRYHRDGLYRQRLEDFDWILQKRELELEREVKACQ